VLLGFSQALAQDASIIDAMIAWHGAYQAGRGAAIDGNSSFTGKRKISVEIVPPETSRPSMNPSVSASPQWLSIRSR
jgi:hypothetical protein